MMAVPVEVLMPIPIVFMLWAPMICFLLLRERVSRWMDARKVRPSFVNGCMQMINGGSLCLALFFVVGDEIIWPLSPFLILYGFWVANGLDRMLGPPEFEVKPFWYVGAGDPSWRDPSKVRFSFRFSLRWVACATLVFCVFAARFSFVWNKQRAATQRHAQAIQAAIDLGAVVDGAGDVSFKGLQAITDEDLAFLSDVKQIRVLDLSGTSITNQSLKLVAKIPKLYSLDLGGTVIDDDGLKLLEGCDDLQYLYLGSTNATGRVLPAGEDGQLGMLDMEGCKIDHESLKNIVKVTQGGGYLRLGNPDIDESMIEILKTTNVNQLHLSETGLTKAARDELKASLSPAQQTRFIGRLGKEYQRRKPPAAQDAQSILEE